VGREDAADQLALVGLAGDEGFGLHRRVALVQAQAGLAAGAVGAVAGEAVLRQDRPDVTVVLDRSRGGANHRDTEAQRRQEKGMMGTLLHDVYLLLFSVSLWLCG